MRWDRKLPLLDRLRATWITTIYHEQISGFIPQEAYTEDREVNANPDGEEAAKLIEQLKNYAVHSTGCSANELDYLDDTPCTCGLRKLLGYRVDKERPTREAVE